MRRLGAVLALMAVCWSSGCGTMVNLLDLDSHGREAYGGVTRDLKFLDEHPVSLPGHGSPGSSWHGTNPLGLAIGLLAYPAIILAQFGIVGAEVSLSWAGDTCTLPLVPMLNRVDSAFFWKPAVLPEDLPGCASSWLRDPRARGWATKDVEPAITCSTSDVPPPEQSSAPERRKQDALPPVLISPDVRQAMDRWEGGQP